MSDEPVARTFVTRVRRVGGTMSVGDIALAALDAQVAAGGWLIANREDLVPEIEAIEAPDGWPGDWFAVTIGPVMTVPDPAFDEPCEWCGLG